MLDDERGEYGESSEQGNRDGSAASLTHAVQDDARHPVRATLDAWRARGADRLDPVRFHFIEALARRVLHHHGEARRVLDERLAGLLDAYAAVVAEADSASEPSAAAGESNDDATLASLVERMAHRARPHGEASAAAYPELPALDYFRDVWSRVRTEKQVRQSLAKVPGNAGPLNSSSLVHRALSLMRELSPEYLKQFLSYVDTLAWLEQMNGCAPAAKETPRAASAGKGTRGKAR